VRRPTLEAEAFVFFLIVAILITIIALKVGAQ